MTHAGEDHGHAGFVGGGNDFFVADRAARLDHAADAYLGGIVDTVAEREEGVGGHHRPFHLQPGMLGLDGGNAGGVDAAHLAGAHAHGLAVLGVDNSVGFDELGHFPGEDQVVHLGFGGGALGDHFQLAFGDHADVTVLHQQATVDALVVQAFCRRAVDLATHQYPYVFLGSGNGQCLIGGRRGDNHFHELTIDNGLGGGGIQLAVEGDDAAESGFGIGFEGQVIGLADAIQAHGHATGVGVFDDHTGRLGEGLYTLQRRVGVGDVVVAQFLALQLFGGGDGRRCRVALGVEGRFLVRVLAVAHVLGLFEIQVDGAREIIIVLAHLLAEVVGNGAVVGGGVFECLDGQIETQGIGQGAVVGGHVVQNALVVRSGGDDAHAGVVLGGRAHHGGAANIDVLDGVFQGAIRVGHGGLERVEVDHYQINAADAVVGHYLFILAATAKNAAVHFRVQGLHPAGHHFRETGVVGDFAHGDALVLQLLVGAAGGEDLHALLGQGLCKFDDTCLVGNTDQCTFNRVAHGVSPSCVLG